MDKKTRFEEKRAELANPLNTALPPEKNGKDLKAKIAMMIKSELEKKGLSYSQFADKVQKQPSEITRWLSGKHNFTLDTLAQIEVVLGIKFFFAEQHSDHNADGEYPPHGGRMMDANKDDFVIDVTITSKLLTRPAHRAVTITSTVLSPKSAGKKV